MTSYSFDQIKGCLVASTNRGCKAISQGGGCRAALLKDGITRAPCLRMPDAMAAAALKRWSETPENFETIKAAFQTTTRFGETGGVCYFEMVYDARAPLGERERVEKSQDRQTRREGGGDREDVSMSPPQEYFRVDYRVLHFPLCSQHPTLYAQNMMWCLGCSCLAGKLQGLMSTVAGRNVYLRFNCFAGDAMGMNMVSKGVLAVVDLLQEVRVRVRMHSDGRCCWR